jgi:hypothetical protein|tara:strand:- start:1128 stop:1337 length:210 start_codon:yes stop_codon:yes gene_type:complete
MPSPTIIPAPLERGAERQVWITLAMEKGFSPSDHSVISFQMSLMSSNHFLFFPVKGNSFAPENSDYRIV